MAKLTDRTKNGNRLDQESFYQWLRRHHQTERAIDNLWNIIVLPAMNDNIRNVSASMALMIFQEGLLKKPGDAAIGFARDGLTSLTGEPALRYLKNRGARLILGRSVKALKVRSGEVKGVDLSHGRTIVADAYISALPFGALLEILPDEVAEHNFFSRASNLTSSPIVGIHMWYDRPVMDEDFVSFLDSPVQWVFNRSRIQQSYVHDGQHVCISVSGAWDYINMPKEDLRRLFASEMGSLFPKALEANIQRFLVVKEPEATFRCVPGISGHRPPQVTPISNFFLAGDWTDTGWPSTMEGAVRSGVFAAEALDARFK